LITTISGRPNILITQRNTAHDLKMVLVKLKLRVKLDVEAKFEHKNRTDLKENVDRKFGT